MSNHLESILGALITNGVLTAVLIYVRSFPGLQRGLGWWAAGLGLNALRLLIYLGEPWLDREVAGFIAESLQAAQSVFLLAGTTAFLGRHLSAWVMATTCAATTAWAALGIFVFHDFVLTAVPLYLLTGLALVASGVLLLRTARITRGAGRTITGIAFVLWGLHKLNFPFLRTVEWFAPWGFMIAQTLALTTAIGIVVMALRALQTQTEIEAAARVAAIADLNRQDDLTRTLLDNLPSSVWVKDLQGRFSLANRKFADGRGFGREEILGKTCQDVLPSDLEERFKRWDRMVLETGKPVQQQFDLVDRDGKQRTYLVTKFPLSESDGQVFGIGGVSTDITDFKRAEDALRDSENTYRTAFRTSPDAINLNRLEDGLYVDINEGFTKLTGFTREDVIGKTSLELGIWADPSDREKLVAGLREHGEVTNLLAVFRRKDGTMLTALMSARVLVLQELPHILSITRDISRLLQVEAAARESDARFRSVIDAAPVGIVLKDLEGHYLVANKKFLSWNDISAADICGQTGRDLFGSDIAELIARQERETLQAEGPVSFELEGHFADGAWRVLSVVRFPVLGPDQAVVGIGAIALDVTREKAAEKESRKIEEWLHTILQSTGEGIYATDLEGRCMLCNPAAAQMLGYVDPDDLLGCHMHETIHHSRPDGSGYPLAECGIHQGLAHDAPSHADDEVYWRRDGRPILVEVQANPAILAGETVGTVVSFSDISERRRTAEHLRQAQKMEAMGHLTSGVAHDFNNILSVIQMNAEMLAEDLEDDPISGGAVTRIANSVQRASDLTNRLMGFSRRQDLSPETLYLGPVVRSMVDILRQTLGETIAILVEDDNGAPPVVVDCGQFENALLNLAINARDAMPTGGSLTIGISHVQPPDLPGKQGESVCLRVTDTGIGMPPEVMERIFEPFFTTKGRGVGTGLGLSMVYGFVRQSGGDIFVDSVEDEGTTFRLYFPVAEMGELRVPAPPVEAAFGNDNSLPPLKILFAEDDAGVRGSTRTILDGCGHTVLQAEDGLVALEILKGTPDIDLLLTDVVMPGGMSGRDLADAALELYPEMKVLYTSGYAKGFVSAEDMKPGATAFLPKPYTKTKLLRALNALWFDVREPQGRQDRAKPTRQGME